MARPADPNAKVDLLRAAEEVFVARGLDHAKVEEITDRAHKSKGAFYLHFASKEDAFRQIIESFLARLADVVLSGNDFLDENPGVAGAAENFATWQQKDCDIFDFIWQNRRIVRLVFEGGKSAEFAYLIDAFAERTRQLTLRALEWGMRQGFYRADLDVEMASLLISGAYDKLARDLVKREHKPDVKRICSEVQRFIISGIVDPKVINGGQR